MVHLRVQSIICLGLHKKVTNSSPKCTWDCKWEGIWNALENALKNGLKGTNGSLKIESESEIFKAPGDAQDRAKTEQR